MYLYFRAMNWLQERREKGQTLVEYALIIVLIAVMLILALTVLRETISQAFSRISSGLSPAAGG
ncbi:MAG: Flp family type IVb pilin [Chloroflexi bacterium]|nr:Flp family type IVb pilin [Chloroflexota bacterium]